MTMHSRVEETKRATALRTTPIRGADTDERGTTSQRVTHLTAHQSEFDITLSAIVAETRNKTLQPTPKRRLPNPSQQLRGK